MGNALKIYFYLYFLLKLFKKIDFNKDIVMVSPLARLVSAVQAAFSCVTGAVVCAWSCTRDLMKSSHFMSEAYAWFGAAYFFYDIWSMYMVSLAYPNLHASPWLYLSK